jgi:aspartate aminotransferase-like enzyme
MTMLFTPGPVKLTDEIRMAQSQEMISHREQRWNVLHMDLVERFKKTRTRTRLTWLQALARWESR